MQLSERLTAVAGLARPCSCLADIGTDHGYVPIFLLENGKIQSAIAMDVNKGPLERADRNIKAHNLTDRITTRLSDGLHALRRGEADGIVVAGMGGALTIKILEEGKEVAEALSYMVLQPQSEIHLVRRYLYEQGYQITDENMIFEDGKYYPMMLVEPKGIQLANDTVSDYQGLDTSVSGNPVSDCGEADTALTDEEAYFGPILIQKKHSVLLKFLLKEEDAIQKIVDSISKNQTEKTLERLAELQADLDRIKRTKEKMV